MLHIAGDRDVLERECRLLRSREDITFAKVQEALNIADAAISEKNDALKREKDIQGEVTGSNKTGYRAIGKLHS